MKTSDAMSVDEALELADEHTQNFKEHASKIVSTLAAEVRRLRAEKADSIARVEALPFTTEGRMIYLNDVLHILNGDTNG